MIVLFVAGLLIVGWLVRQVESRLAFFPYAGEDRTPRAFGIEFSAHTVNTRDGEQLRAWHLPRTDALAQVVYFHGNGGNLSLWSDVLAGLWEQRLDVFAVDYRGYGLSSGRPTETGLYRDVEASIALVDDELRRVDVPLVFWGRSLGSVMAAYAARHRAPDGVVLEAGFPAARAVLETNPLMWLLSFFSTYRFPTSEWMSHVKTPSLVLHGDRDSVIPYRLGQQLYESLPGPKRFVTIPGGDHNDPVPTAAELYWGAVRDFVGTLPRE